MPDVQQMVVELPTSIVNELNGLVGSSEATRNQVIEEAMRLYLAEQRQETLRQELRTGYEEMAELNLTLAEEGWWRLNGRL